VKPAEELSNCTLVVFTHHQKIENSPSIHPVGPETNQSDYVRSLENELVETKNNLQLVVEDLETVNEELQSSNEELLSANEELQSSNEELQSLNEELHTLNTEHQLKIKELLELNDDLNNYFRSTDIGQIFVTSDLRIRKFNTASARMVNFIESDLGRPITHISTNIRYENLHADIDEVLHDGNKIEREVQLLNGRNVLMRVLPYITREQKSDGVIISFIDITVITNLNNIVRGVFNASQSAIFAFNSVRSSDSKIEDFRVITCNHAANRFLNNDQASYDGKSLKKDIPLLCINGMFHKYIDVVLHDKTLREDFYVESEGTWYDISAVKMMDGFVATCNDITEKKVAEQGLKKNYGELVAVKDNLKRLNDELENKVVERTQALSKSEERFRIVSQATNDAIWDWDFAQNKVWYGEGFLKLFGHHPKNNESVRAEWLELVHPDDRVQTKDSLYHIINTLQNQWSHEYRFRRADGSYANVLDRGYVLHDENGTPYRMLGSMLDLTELKRAELEVENNIAQREFLAESMPLIVCVADPNFGLSFVNNQFNRYTGLSFEDVFAQGWKLIMHHDDYDQFIKAWEDARDRQRHFELEVRLFHQGEYHWNLLRANARMQSDRVIMNWVLTFIDIHTQKSLNETLEQKVKSRTVQLQRMNEALEASNHDLQQFASVASHDLQEPLRKIHMFSKLVRDKGVSLPEESKRYLDKIMQASSRMKSIITNVLNFSRLSAEDNKFESVDLGELIGDLLEDLEVAIQERGARVDIGGFCRVEVIPGQMRQVFQNLISNSLKFSKPNVNPYIKVSSETVGERSFESKHQENGPYCRITIQDNGIGFNEKFKENIFDLFHRLHSKDTYEGTGIGLAIVKKILGKHGGIITASSKEDEGATFVIVLPVEHGERSKKVNHYDQANIISG
jgi:two-component system CheB/CheR fusion protein